MFSRFAWKLSMRLRHCLCCPHQSIGNCNFGALALPATLTQHISAHYSLSLSLRSFAPLAAVNFLNKKLSIRAAAAGGQGCSQNNAPGLFHSKHHFMLSFYYCYTDFSADFHRQTHKNRKKGENFSPFLLKHIKSLKILYFPNGKTPTQAHPCYPYQAPGSAGHTYPRGRCRTH